MNKKVRYTFSPIEKSLPLYMTSIGYNPQELQFNRPEGLPYYQWLHTARGEGLIQINQEQFILKQGDGVLITPYTSHSYQPNPQVSKEWSTMYLTFSGLAIEQIMDALEMNYTFVYHESEKKLFYQMISEILSFIQDSKLDISTINLDLSAKIYSFIIALNKHAIMKNRIFRMQTYEKIKPVVEWLEEAYHKNIGLFEISNQAQLSPQYLNKLFHETFNLSPYSFLVQLRIREAKRILLTEKDMTLKEIARMVGFNSVSHFAATFKQREGMTPTQYRQLHQK